MFKYYAEIHDMFQDKFIKEYGQIYCAWIFTRPTIAFATPSAIEVWYMF